FLPDHRDNNFLLVFSFYRIDYKNNSQYLLTNKCIITFLVVIMNWEIKKYSGSLRSKLALILSFVSSRNFYFIIFIIFLISLNTCSENPVEDQDPITIFPIPPLYFSNPAWHPNSNWIAVVHADSVDTNSDGIDDRYFSGIWLINAETRQKNPFLEYSPSWYSWSKDGHELAMVIRGQIYTINIPSVDPIEIDTASLTQLTFESGYFPSFSPDGDWIVYDSGQDSPGPNYIWKMRVDGSEKKCISITGTGEWRMPDWSPVGNSILHQRAIINFGAEIFLMDTMGNEIKRLTIDLDFDRYPKFSSSGDVVGFLSKPLNGPRKIRIINSDGTNLRSVSPDWAYLFDFSPDGSKIVFVLYSPDSAAVGNGQIWMMNADGSNVIQLTNYNP
ncbi:MAG: hypothetical protein MUP85_23515, partial [Candidatus Lokiarchaeota archaeon]|nr:hypothetical protein [Candidatus Lokiarchaeota archaeon]